MGDLQHQITSLRFNSFLGDAGKATSGNTAKDKVRFCTIPLDGDEVHGHNRREYQRRYDGV